jgi:hypothetical protein
MSTTIFDRLMHRCTMLEFEGRSYRLKEAAARLTREAANTPLLKRPAWGNLK